MSNPKNTLARESNFELLRICAMFFIVFYHILIFFVVSMDSNIIYKAIQLPLHVAVICFILISGYFQIRPSVKGVGKFLAPLIIYHWTLSLIEYFFTGPPDNNMGGVRFLLFFSQSPYWFIRTYFYLYLIAPMINKFITNKATTIYLLIVTGGISLYMSFHWNSLFEADPSLSGGKNLVLFMFVYVLGGGLRSIKSFDRFPVKYVLSIYVIFNILLISCYLLFHNTAAGCILWILSFPYCGPVLIINAVLLFLVFSRIKLKSRFINNIGKSVFSIYLIHHNHYVLFFIIAPFVTSIIGITSTPSIVLALILCLTFGIMIACILIDRAMAPILWFSSKVIERGILLLQHAILKQMA